MSNATNIVLAVALTSAISACGASTADNPDQLTPPAVAQAGRQQQPDPVRAWGKTFHAVGLEVENFDSIKDMSADADAVVLGRVALERTVGGRTFDEVQKEAAAR